MRLAGLEDRLRVAIVVPTVLVVAVTRVPARTSS